MPRINRVTIPGIPHHITQRGNSRRKVFFSDADFTVYLDLLKRYAEDHAMRVWAYCLMTNHVHLIAVPERENSLARTLSCTHADYARYRNAIDRGCGHVWQSRFFSCPLDGAHRWRALAYVEQNPVRAGMAATAGEYRWSSARTHLSGATEDEVLDLGPWRENYDALRWREALRSGIDNEAFGTRLREASFAGRPLGSEGFIDSLERQTGRTLRRRSPGRPKKSEAEVAVTGF